MKVKEILRLFTPPVYYELKHMITRPKQRAIRPMPLHERRGDKMIVIGNGPSLNKTMELYRQQVLKTECIMVNESCLTPLYEEIAPSVYVLVDPVYYEEDKYPAYVATREAVVEAIVIKTSWPMEIIMSNRAMHSRFATSLEKNPNIHILYYEDSWNQPKNMTLFEAWDKNFITPPGQTVLNTAIWASIYWGYKETYIIGADTSFIHDIYVSQKDNVLYTVDTHFYNNEDVYHEEFEPEKHGRKLSVDMEHLLDAVHTMIKSYRELREYAAWKGVKIFNASEYSMIDCYDRKKLK